MLFTLQNVKMNGAEIFKFIFSKKLFFSGGNELLFVSIVFIPNSLIFKNKLTFSRFKKSLTDKHNN